jgi:hypothetical protein
MTLTVDDLTLLSGNPVRVLLPAGQHQLVYVFSAWINVPYGIADLRTPAKVEQAVTAHSNVHYDGTIVDVDGFTGCRLRLLRLGLSGRLHVSTSFFILATWLNGNLFEAL